MMQESCKGQSHSHSTTATSANRCPVCEDIIKDVTIIPIDEDTHPLNELAMLTHPSIINTCIEDESIESYIPQVKIDCYYIVDEYDHIVPFDTGLIEAGHKLYLYGQVSDILSDDTESDMDDSHASSPVKVSAGKLGPITEWWFSGFDGTHSILLGVESEFASYILTSPHPLYNKFVIKLTEQIFLTKLVIEFLQIICNDTADEDSYANLLESVESRSLGKFDQDFLLSHANFVIRQIISYDDAGDSDEPKLLETAAMQEFIRLVGLNFSSTRPATQLRITRKDKRRSCNSDYETVTTPLIRQFFQPLIVKSHPQVSSNTCKEQVKSSSLPKSRKRTLSDRILNFNNISSSPGKVKWHLDSSCVFDKNNDTKYFCSFKMGSESYAKGHFIAYTTKEYSSNSEAVKFGQIRWIREEETSINKRKSKVLHLLNLIEASETILGSNVTLGKLQDKTLYATESCISIPFEFISSMTKITVITCNLTGNSLVMSRDDLTNNNSGASNAVYYCNKLYHRKTGWFTDGSDELFNVNRFKCTSCIAVSRDAHTVVRDAYEYTPQPMEVGSYVLLNPDAIKKPLNDYFNEWLSESYHQSLEDSMKEEYDGQIYTEKYRKSFVDSTKGSLLGLIATYSVGLVVDVDSAYSADVRLLYRPENIYPDPEHVLNCDERELFLTDIVINVTSSASVGTLVKKKWNKNFKHEFTTDFFVERSYLTKTGTICILSDKVILSLDTEDENDSNQLIPLSSLDLFAGCGAFSLGFEQMNVTRTKWAIERDPIAAESFKQNFPHAIVTVKDANQVLKEISDEMMCDDVTPSGDKCKTSYPVKGEIDIILAGPPCQGFSEMNRFTDGYASTLKNSLIATTLSFVDIYRPKYVYIENVRNFFKFKESHVFRLTVSSLLYMGYQVSFCLLQAGSLGVPQSRCRAIIIATASGLTIPKMPHLTTSFPSKLIPTSIVVQENRYSLNVIPYSLHRTLTIKDAINDLPFETVDDANNLLPYRLMQVCSSYQKKMRSLNATHVSDQAARSTGILVSARIKLIPKIRGADWRDLPNICVKLNDSLVTQKLLYTHHDMKVNNNRDVLTGVCSCSEISSDGSNGPCNGDKQSNTLIPWCLVHTASKNYHWVGVYGRVCWDEFFSTTVTIPEPSAKQGRVIHPSEDRLLTVREFARSQGIPDWFTISGKLNDRHRQIGNAVPPPLASSLARCLLRARIDTERPFKKVKTPVTWD